MPALRNSQKKENLLSVHKQREAVIEAMLNGVTRIIGRLWTGKTTTENCITIKLMEQQGTLTV